MTVPTHMGIIMEGTGEWAEDQGLDRNAGNIEGLKTAWRISRAAGTAGVKYLSFYFSDEKALFQAPAVLKVLDRLAAKVKVRTGITIRLVLGTGFREDRPQNQGSPDIDLLVRTGGTRRLANAFVGRAKVPDLVFSSKRWPEFSVDDLKTALKDFAVRGRWLRNLAGLLPAPTGRILLN